MIPPFNTEYILMSTKSFYLTHNLKSMFVSPALTRIKYLFVFSAKIHPKCTTKAMMIRWWWREEGKNRAMNLEDWTRENFLSRIKYNWGCFSSVLQLLHSAFVKEHHLSYFILFLFHIIIRCVIEYIYQVTSIQTITIQHECQVYNPRYNYVYHLHI